MWYAITITESTRVTRETITDSVSCFEVGKLISDQWWHHKNVIRIQEGGTIMLLFEPLIQQLDFEHAVKYNIRLGIWCYMKFCGSEVINTIIVCGYNPCYNKRKESNNKYHQHRQLFITKQKDRTCPRKRFREDLVVQLKHWREKGD